MLANLRGLGRSIFKKIPLVLVFWGLLFGPNADLKASSIPERIAAVQKAFQRLPASAQQPILFSAQWGNWGNWNNWNNWGNWSNWANFNNWGNF